MNENMWIVRPSPKEEPLNMFGLYFNDLEKECSCRSPSPKHHQSENSGVVGCLSFYTCRKANNYHVEITVNGVVFGERLSGGGGFHSLIMFFNV